MKKRLFALFLACCASLTSCRFPLDEDYCAMQLLIGRDVNAFYQAMGPPTEQSGTAENGNFRWFEDYTMDTYSVIDTRVTFEKNRAVLLTFKGDDYDVVKESWIDANYPFMRLNKACHDNDLDEVMFLLAQYKVLRERSVIIQAAAQAARYSSHETRDYLISKYQLDIHEPIISWIDNEPYYIRIVLVETTLAKLMRLAEL